MKVIRLGFFLALAAGITMAATVHLGNRIFLNEEGPINLAADAGLAEQNLDSPYVMFVLYMGADSEVKATVGRESVVLVHNDKEYRMVDIQELRKNYRNDSRDIEHYVRLAKEPLIFSRMKFYRFDGRDDFFPERSSGRIPRQSSSIGSQIGFATRAYFKNPGFEPGDVIMIKVSDSKNPDIWGAVALEL